MRRQILLFSNFILLIHTSPQPPDDGELIDLPFNTQDLPSFFDNPAVEQKDNLLEADVDERLKTRLKMKRMFSTAGPPGIGTDIFAINLDGDQNLKAFDDTEGSGTEDHESEEEISKQLTKNYENVTLDNSKEYQNNSSNSSLLFDQNTSDAEVVLEKISEDKSPKEMKVQIEAELINESKEILDGEMAKNSNFTDKEVEIEPIIECSSPQPCAKNCFIYINELGCQDCQCLWIASDCEVDKDCPEKNQYCDLGRCNCQPGYRQNMKKSGVCEIDLGLPMDFRNKIARETNLKDLSKKLEEMKKSKRLKREVNKPRSAERLEWPGICDKNEQCPENLVCIHGDCWHLPEKKDERIEVFDQRIPEKMIISRNSEDDVKFRRVSFDTSDISTQITTTSTIVPALETKKGMSRFVSEDFVRQMQRTTTSKNKHADWFPPTTTILPAFRSRKSVTNDVPPLNVDQFFIIETTTSPLPPIPKEEKFENLKERKPYFLGDFNNFDWTTGTTSTISPEHIKKIHLHENSPLQKFLEKPRTRTTTPFPDDSSEVNDNQEINNIEFPISSRIGKTGLRPRALSAEPTTDELRDHEKLTQVFKTRVLEQEFALTSTIQPDNFDFKQFEEEEPDIQLSTKNPIIPSIPILPSEEKRKPFVIHPSTKFTTIPPLDNLSGDMAADDPKEEFPEHIPYDKHQDGIWYPMKKGDIPHLGIFVGEVRRAPTRRKTKSADDLRLYNEYTKSNRQNRPVRIEMDNALKFMKNECQNDKNCGNLTVCCTKKWCDRTNHCGTGKFCLSSCDSTKLTFLPSSNHAEGIIDIMYD